MIKIIRVNRLCDILSVSRSTLWRMEQTGELPRRRQIAKRTVGWLESEIEEWLKSRPSAYQDKSTLNK
ncbi:helix-turn-helix transcriptional regulator [Rhodohalobacter sp. 614A]|uniref:helix-turn-helix transcriptional regulator n=1 Tax=Rhodohalobacter sp. 614A TaxID=2908649 RepID=UPI00351D98DF